MKTPSHATPISYLHQPESGFYVYALWNPITNQPFYIGKGKRDRAFVHLGHKDKYNPFKQSVIASIRSQLCEPSVKLIWHGLDEAHAFWIEEFAIALWGRKCDGGPLTNLRKGGQGAAGISSESSKNKSDQQRGSKNHQFGKVGPLSSTYGRVVSEDQKRRQSEAMKKNWQSKRHLWSGRVVSEETRLKMSLSQDKRAPDVREKYRLAAIKREARKREERLRKNIIVPESDLPAIDSRCKLRLDEESVQ